MRYNTGNPVEPSGSSDFRDAHDNTGNLDLAMNGSALAWVDRTGKEQKSWKGILQQVTDYLIDQSYESVYLTYGVGVVVERQTQLVQRSGELYRVMNASDIPLTLTGTWATDAPKLQAVGDAALRQALAASGGSAMVGRGSGTVENALAALEGRATAVEGYGVAKLPALTSKSHMSVNGVLAAQNPWGVRCLNVFGDSISFGANCSDIERDSWVGLTKKMLNIEFGQSNIGLLNIVTQSGTVGDPFKQYFSAYTGQTGTWDSITNAAASHIPFGFAIESSVAGSAQYLRAPLSQRYMRLWYDGTVTGEIEVVINSAVVQTIATTGAGTGYDRGAALELGSLVASNQGVVSFILRCKSGTIRLTGLEFTNDATGNSFRVNNFSRDGRAGQYVGQDVINKACAGCYAFIWALATNDITNYSPAVQTAYDQRIDWIIAAAAANRTKVVFIDFLYNQPYSHGLRASMRRGAASIPNAILIEADQVWTVAGAQYSDAERIQRSLSSGVHPEEIGHRLIAETLAQRLGLNCNAKKQAIRRDPMWKALDISASGFANNSTEPGKFTGYRIGERAIEVVVNLATVPSGVGPFTIGTIPAAEFPVFAGVNLKSNPDATGKSGLFTITSSGGIVYRTDPTITGTPTTCSLYAMIPYSDAYNWF
jgi:hypothetical protein